MLGVVERLDGVEQSNPLSTAMLEGAMKGRGFWSCLDQFSGIWSDRSNQTVQKSIPRANTREPEHWHRTDSLDASKPWRRVSSSESGSVTAKSHRRLRLPSKARISIMGTRMSLPLSQPQPRELVDGRISDDAAPFRVS